MQYVDRFPRCFVESDDIVNFIVDLRELSPKIYPMDLL